jgi:1-acyl-sn-glycerol-3-phosphate acyltransferase
MVIVTRSGLFNLAFYLWALVMNVIYVPALAGHRLLIVHGQALWARGILKLMAWIAGMKVEVRGLEHLPKGGVLVASKHQSAFDTFVYHALLEDPAFVLKKELLAIPIYGWYCRKTEMIPVDRAGGTKALKSMMNAAKKAITDGRPVLIFPEGTRSSPGTEPDYQPGIAGLYKTLNVPVVPVALNSGLFWPRRSFLRRPGTIVVEFLEPIPAGLKRPEFMARLRDSIEVNTRRLEQEARADLS